MLHKQTAKRAPRPVSACKVRNTQYATASRNAHTHYKLAEGEMEERVSSNRRLIGRKANDIFPFTDAAPFLPLAGELTGRLCEVLEGRFSPPNPV